MRYKLLDKKTGTLVMVLQFFDKRLANKIIKKMKKNKFLNIIEDNV